MSAPQDDIPSWACQKVERWYAWPDDWVLYSVPLDGYMYEPSKEDPTIYIPVGLAPSKVEEEPVPTALYRLRDDDGALLYVGISTDPLNRWKRHASDKPWWSSVTAFTLQWFATRQKALGAEALAIRSERPRYNVVHNVKPAA